MSSGRSNPSVPEAFVEAVPLTQNLEFELTNHPTTHITSEGLKLLQEKRVRR